MLDWIFGSSKAKQEKPEKKETTKVQIPEEDSWAYDFIKQYLVSPIWRNPLLDFIEDNCLAFEDTEQNKFQYTPIFKQFTALCAQLLESIIQETGISEKTLELCIHKGLNEKQDRKIFQQVILCDNFLAFKKIMIQKNKEMDIAAVQQLGSKQTPKQQKIDEMELERLEIQKAIALSLALEQKMKQQEEKELEEAIRQSHISASKAEEKNQQKNTGGLPPLVIGSNREQRTISEFKEEEKKIVKEIQSLKVDEQSKKDEENAEDRRKRLLEQRELIKKKKAEERKKQLDAFVQAKPVQGSTETKVSEQELERRRKLMQRLKQQLKD